MATEMATESAPNAAEEKHSAAPAQGRSAGMWCTPIPEWKRAWRVRCKSALTARGCSRSSGKSWCPLKKSSRSKGGKKSITERRMYSGYVLVEMDMTDEAWHLVKSTSKVTGFLGGSANRPSPLRQKEVDEILMRMQEGAEKPRPKTLWEVGEMVRVKDGPFTDFNGNVEEVNYEKSRMRVSVTIFGRSTPVELEFGQVEKV
jgi:transcriptional antiterminator NusG